MTLPVVFTANGPSGYNLTNSLRFRSSASAYLNRTPAGSPTSTQKFTQSYWVKRGTLSTTQYIYNCEPSDWVRAYIFSDNIFYFDIRVSGTNYSVGTTQVFRDPSAWYHIVISVDTTQATAANRVIIYVNGVQAPTNTPTIPQNSVTVANSANPNFISAYKTPNQYFDGYLAEVNFIDGQALTPSSFGETSSTTGVWIPKKYTGTYGTNGFYLPFTDNSALTTSSNVGLGKDFSGNGNYWTTNNISITSGSTYDSMTDVPTLTSATVANYCVLNGASVGTDATLSNGNLNISYGSSGTRNATMGTIGMSSGKWYAEFSFTSGSFPMFGITSRASSNDIPSYPGSNAFGWGYFVDGDKYTNNTNTAYGATWTTNDVIGVAFDADVGSLTFYKNGISQGVAFTGLTSGTYFFAVGDGGGAATWSGWANFGQRPFSYTPPTGFVALNTFNLPTPTIGATASTTANDYFDATLYTGNGTTQSIVNSGPMQPDFVWVKRRDGTNWHNLADSVRGTGKRLFSNTTNAEDTSSGLLTSFNSNGFTVGSEADYNINGGSFVAWQWRASNATAVTNTAGSITSTVSANTSAGFSIVTYTGTGANATVGHGLGVALSMVIVKQRNGSNSFPVWHSGLTGGSGYYVYLDLTNSVGTASSVFNATNPTSTLFSVGTNSLTNGNTDTYVAYCFAPIAGYSAFGSYTGNGSTDGTFVYTGFRPRFVMVKRTDTGGYWSMKDTARDPYNVAGNLLFANASDAEYSNNQLFDLNSNGFKLRGSNSDINASGGTYIYMAFAETPLKFSNAR